MIESSRLLVEIKTKEPKLREELRRLITSVGGFHIQDVGHQGPCDLLILEVGGDIQEEFQLINRIHASGSATEIFLTSQSTEPTILMNAMRLGIREFFPQPLREEEVKGALVKLRRRGAGVAPVETTASRAGQIINILGAKGGVGTTTIAVNLATNFAALESSPQVALIDMNLLFGEIPLFLGMKPVFDWLEVTRNVSRLDETYLMGILLKHASGVHVLPSPAKLVEDHAVPPEVIKTLLELMQRLFDFVVVDSGQSLDGLSKAILQLSDRVVLVTIPSLPGVVNVKRLLDTFRNLGYPPEERIDIAANRYNQKSGISLEQTERTLSKKVAWTIPNDYRNTMNAINSGEPLTSIAKGAEITRTLIEMASTLARREPVRKTERKRSFFGLIQL